MMVLHVQHDVAEHLHEPPIGVPDEPLVAGKLDHRRKSVVVEAQIQHGVHHARHGHGGATANRNQQRIGAATERLAGGLLELLDVGVDLSGQLGRILPPKLVERGARLCRDREAGRHRQAQRTHLSQVGALAAKQLLHRSVAFALAATKEIHVLALLSHLATLRLHLC